MLISITGSNEELEEIWEKLKEATPHLEHNDSALCRNVKVGSISLHVHPGVETRLSYYNCLGFEAMEYYDKRYVLNNIHHFACFMRAVKDVHDKLK